DADVREVVGRADTREHQQLWAGLESARHDDLVARANRPADTAPPLVDHLDADGTVALDHELRREYLGLDLEGARGEVVHVAARGGVANAVLDVLLQEGDALLLHAVVIVEDLHAER